MKRKILSILAALALILSLTFVTAAAVETDVVLSVGNAEAEAAAGTTIEIPVSITTNPGLVVGRATVTWDSEALELTSVKYGTDLGQDNGSPETITQGSYAISFGDYTPGEDPGADWTETGELFVLNFTVLDGAAAGTYEIGLSGNKNAFLNNAIEEQTVSCTAGAVVLYNEISTVELTVAEPVKGAEPQTEVSGTGFTGEIVWEPIVEGTFAANKTYTATVTVTAEDTYVFADEVAVTLNDQVVTAEKDGDALVIIHTFGSTGKNKIAAVDLVIAEPVKGAVPQDTIAPGEGYTGVISWNGNPEKFAADTIYTATVVLTPSTDYEFAAEPSAGVNGNEATTVEVAEGKLTVTYTFGATGGKESQTINCADTVTATYGDEAKALGATAETDLSYKVIDGDDVVRVAADGTVTFRKAGTAIIQISAAETDDYHAAVKNVTVTVSPADYTYVVENAQDIKSGSGLSAIIAPANGTGVNSAAVAGTLKWYTDAERSVEAIDANLTNLISGEEITLYWEFTVSDGGYTAEAKTGCVEITVYMKGDVNLDGRVTDIDAMILARYKAGWNGYEAKILSAAAADLDGANGIGDVDAMILARWLAGWPGYDSYLQ